VEMAKRDDSAENKKAKRLFCLLAFLRFGFVKFRTVSLASQQAERVRAIAKELDEANKAKSYLFDFLLLPSAELSRLHFFAVIFICSTHSVTQKSIRTTDGT
jgi:hypothetical protein